MKYQSFHCEDTGRRWKRGQVSRGLSAVRIPQPIVQLGILFGVEIVSEYQGAYFWPCMFNKTFNATTAPKNVKLSYVLYHCLLGKYSRFIKTRQTNLKILHDEKDALKGGRNARRTQFYMHYMYTNHNFTLASFSTDVDRKIKRLFNCYVEKGITPGACSGR